MSVKTKCVGSHVFTAGNHGSLLAGVSALFLCRDDSSIRAFEHLHTRGEPSYYSNCRLIGNSKQLDKTPTAE
jgi:hypothetical protein